MRVETEIYLSNLVLKIPGILFTVEISKTLGLFFNALRTDVSSNKALSKVLVSI